MPVSTVTTARWICDRCGARKDFPDPEGRMPRECGWLIIDLGASLRDPTDEKFSVNKQVLCPVDLDKLLLWFENSATMSSSYYNDDEDLRYATVVQGRKMSPHADLYRDEVIEQQPPVTPVTPTRR